MEADITPASINPGTVSECDTKPRYLSNSQRKKMLAESYNRMYEEKRAAIKKEEVRREFIRRVGGRDKQTLSGIVHALFYIGIYSGFLTKEDVWGTEPTNKSFGRVGIARSRGAMSTALALAVLGSGFSW